MQIFVYFYDVLKENIHGCVSFCLMQEIDLPSLDRNRKVIESGGYVNEVRRDSACVSVVSD